MALDFPNSPTLGQVFNDWGWDGSKWVLLGPDSGLVVQSGPITDVLALGTGATGLLGYWQRVDNMLHLAGRVTTNNAFVAGTGVLSLTWKPGAPFIAQIGSRVDGPSNDSSSGVVPGRFIVDQTGFTLVVSALAAATRSWGFSTMVEGRVP